MEEFVVAGPERRTAVVDCLASAFDSDPVWSTAFPDPARRSSCYQVLWGLIVDNALPHRGVWTDAAGSAAAVWLPPGADELSEADAARLPDLMVELVGERSPELLEVFEQFDTAHPDDEPHYYLDLLGTHLAQRGRGIGMRLLRHTLSVIDGTGMPCYLESSNPANNARYQSAGFQIRGQFTVFRDQLPITTMWRPGSTQARATPSA